MMLRKLLIPESQYEWLEARLRDEEIYREFKKSDRSCLSVFEIRRME